MKIIKLVVFLVILIKIEIVLSNIIIETVYSDPALDGYIHFSQNSQSYSVNNWMYEIIAGDTWGVFPINPDYNSYFRGYISFDLPEIPENYYVDSVYVRLYQFLSTGYNASNGNTTDFPVWNVAGGDTIKCILSHINYGSELDESDWEKGDINNPYTYQNNVGTLTEDGGNDYRYIDVTINVVNDYSLNRNKTQYRIAFQIDTDWDDWDDMVGFISGNPPIDEYTPIIVIRFSDENNSIEDIEITSNQNVKMNIYPNPVKDNLDISFSQNDLFIEKFEIFNIKGQKIKSFHNTQKSNYKLNVRCSEIQSGIYFLKVFFENKIAVKKFLVMK